MITSKYPKAIPCHSPEELAAQNNRLNQRNEELAVRAKRLSQWSEDLTRRAARLRQWTYGLVGLCAILLLASVGAAVVVMKNPPPASSPLVPMREPALPLSAAPSKENRPAPPTMQAKVAPSELPSRAVAKPDVVFAVSPKGGYLEALGGLSATHLYQTHLNIGLLADGVESETYTIEEADKNLKTVVELMNLVDGQLTKVTTSGLDLEDQDSIRQIQTVTGLLHLEADALRAYWKTGAMQDADRYHQARRSSWSGLSKIMGPD